MVRISDILRRMGGEEEPFKKTPPFEERKEERPPPSAREKPPVQFREKIIPTTKLGTEAAQALYERLLAFAVTEIFDQTKKETFQIEGAKIQEAIEPVVDHFQKGETDLLYFATLRGSPEYYLHTHAVNVSIFAVFLGMGLGYDRERLMTLAMGALLCDVGMVKVMGVVQRPGKLTPEEREAMQKHVQFNVDILKNIKDLPEKTLEITQKVHERHNGKGYPSGLSGESLSEDAQIVALCDMYEALTHPRAYRDSFSPYQALKEILNEKDLFDPRLLKHFVQQLTIYPIGSWVELSTGEQGQVMMTTPRLPLRPTIRVFFDSQSKKLPAPKVVDLSQHATLYVKRCLEAKKT